MGRIVLGVGGAPILFNPAGIREAMPLRTVRKKLSDPRVRRSVFRVLEQNGLCSIATVTPEGRAHINTAYFVYPKDLDLYFFSYPTSLHCRNLTTNPSMAMTIFRSDQPWGTPGHGIQLFGLAREVRGADAANAERVYARRFPRYATWMRGRTEDHRRMAVEMRALRFYRFRPTRVKLLDERVYGGAVFVVAGVQKRRSD